MSDLKYKSVLVKLGEREIFEMNVHEQFDIEIKENRRQVMDKERERKTRSDN